MLKLEKISTFYGKIQALNQVSLEVGRGAIATLIGANGAGKSTTLKTIVAGPRPPRAGFCSTARTSPACPPTGSWPGAWPWSRRAGRFSGT